MEFQKLIDNCVIRLSLHSQNRNDVFRELIGAFHEKNIIRDSDELYQKLLARESMASTIIGPGIAIPHTNLPYLDQMVLAIGRSSDGIVFDSETGQKVFLVFLLLSPEDEDDLHLKILARFARILKNKKIREKLLQVSDPSQIKELFHEHNVKVP